MKNQYFGDINDYRKYGLLRGLADAGLSIGVCWLLTEDDGQGDGELRRYLAKPSHWRRYDPELYDRLQRLRHPGVQRDLRHAAEWELVPGAIYFDEIVTDTEGQRDAYFDAAFEALHGSDVIFFDPDIGIEVPSTGRGKRGSASYIYWTELRKAYVSGHSVLVYQHFPRVERARFVPFLAGRLGDELGARQVAGFTTPHVAFFLVQQPIHGEILGKAAAVVESTWRGQIKLWPPISSLSTIPLQPIGSTDG